MTDQSTISPQRSGEETTGVADSARHVADDVETSVRDAAGEVAEDVKTHTLHVIDDAKSQVRSQAETQTHRASEFTRDLAHELESMAEHGDSGYLTSLAHDGASRLDRISSQLDERGLEGALDDVRRFARRRPGMFLASCFGAGIVLGRIIHNDDSTISDAMSSRSGDDSQQVSQSRRTAPTQDLSSGSPR